MNYERYFHPDDPEWMAGRRGEWTKARVVLGKLKMSAPDAYRYHKEFFLYGRIDPGFFFGKQRNKDLPDAFDMKPHFFMMAYHPEPTVENLSLIWSQVASIKSDASEWEVNNVRSNVDDHLCYFFGLSAWTIADRKYGAWGGRESAIAAAMCPFDIWKKDYIMPGLRYYSPVYLFMTYVVHVTNVLRQEDVNPYLPGIYLEKHALWLIENRLDEMLLKGEDLVKDMAAQLANIVSRDNLEGISDKNSVPYELWKRLYDGYIEGTLPDFLLQYWKPVR